MEEYNEKELWDKATASMNLEAKMKLAGYMGHDYLIIEVGTGFTTIQRTGEVVSIQDDGTIIKG